MWIGVGSFRGSHQCRMLGLGRGFQKGPINVGYGVGWWVEGFRRIPLMLGRGFQEVSKIPLLIPKNQSLSSCFYPLSFGICLFSSCCAFHFGNYWLVTTKEAPVVCVTSRCKTPLLCYYSPTYRRPISSSTTTSTILFSC